MGKRHKRRRMVNKIAPHKGPVFLLAKPASLPIATALQRELLARPVNQPTSAELMADFRTWKGMEFPKLTDVEILTGFLLATAPPPI